MRPSRNRLPGAARASAALVSCLALAMPLAACTYSAPDEDGVPSPSSAPDEGGVPSPSALAVHPRVEFGMDALLEGTLRTDDGCVRVVMTDDFEAVVSFPSGDASFADGVLTWRDGDYRDGDRISLGGGFASADSGYVPEACGEREVFLVSPV